MAELGSDFVIIGGGFIGSEIAAALAMNGKRVSIIFPETGIGARVYPRELSDYLNEYYHEHGVEVITDDVPAALEKRGGRQVDRTRAGLEIACDGVVGGLGIAPNAGLADQAGLNVDNGVVVDGHLNAGRADIFAAGDVASFHNTALNRRLRVEHEDNALTMGGIAGRNMAGAGESYDYLPYFYTDLFALGYEAVGETDPQINETISDWKDPFREGVIYYLKDGRVRGVILWNVWDKVDAARALIADPGPFTAGDLKGRISA